MKTILFVETGSGFGGSATCLSALLRPLNRQRYRPLVAYYAEGFGIERVRAQGVPAIRLRRGRSWWQLVRLIRRERVDLIHGNNELYSHAASILAAQWTRRPYVLHMRGIRHLTRLERWLSRRVRHFIIISEIGRRHYAAEGIPDSRTTTIHDGMDLTVFNGHLDRRAARQTLRMREEDLVIGMVTRLVPKKGAADFLQALAQLHETHPEARGLVVGGDPEPGAPHRRELEQLARALKLSDRVVFTGWRDDIPLLTASFDIAVQASHYIEGLGVSIMEAMALGKPVVATAVGGIPEMVEPDRTGLLVPAGDIPAMAAALRRLADDAALRRRFGEAGRARILERFDQTRQTERIEALYAALLGAEP